jgi:hypothetical protein
MTMMTTMTRSTITITTTITVITVITISITTTTTTATTDVDVSPGPPVAEALRARPAGPRPSERSGARRARSPGAAWSIPRLRCVVSRLSDDLPVSPSAATLRW